ncbi:hypothetical protein, partial [Escherichia coli]|uniref:hypothetical protein n=1 Tax=Escherichia coli TaxID=562 RepID=UPI001EDC163F
MDVAQTSNELGEISLPSEGYGEWIWQVTPKKSGVQYLTLRLFAPGSDGSDITLETFSEKIEVRVGFQYLVSNFVKEYF